MEALVEELIRANLLERQGGQFRAKLVGLEFVGKLKAFHRDNYAELDTPELPEPLHFPDLKRIAALPEDIVRAQLVQVGRSQFLGEVVEVIEHSRREFIGTIEHGDRTNYFVPQDAFLRRDFIVPNDKLKGARNGQKVRVHLLEWYRGQPRAEVIEVLGDAGGHELEMHAIIYEFRLEPGFPKAAEEEANAFPEKLTDKEIAARRDFRAVPTVTIDPVDAKDFDDALSFRVLDNGNYEVGVHIADVTHYVRPGSALEEIAAQKATSVYLVDRTLPMLPERLSNDLCSLRPNIDRPAFSAVFELTPQAEVVNEWFGRTMIHSDRRFAYEDAQAVLDAGGGEFFTELNTLNRLAYALRENRFAEGSIAFETDEVRFILDETGFPVEVFVKDRFDAHKLIEDFMLLANRRVARFLAKHPRKPAVPYRVHPRPDGRKLKDFRQFAARFGYAFRGDELDGADLARAFNELTETVQGKPEGGIIQSMAIRTMPKAVYSTDNIGHYGLGFTYYAHFTSPIRRYPDVLTHRALAAILEEDKLLGRREMETLCEHASEREKIAANAERASIKFKQAELLGAHLGEVYTGIISGITDWGLYILLDGVAAEGMAWLRDLPGDYYQPDELKQSVRGKRTGKTYVLGDKVQAEIVATDIIKRNIDLKLVV